MKCIFNTSYITQIHLTNILKEIVKLGTYRVTHKGCDFSDNLKLLKFSNFKNKIDLPFHDTLLDIYS